MSTAARGSWMPTGAARPTPRSLEIAPFAAAEVYLYLRYAALGTQFHFWLHALVGGAIGFAVLAAVALVRRRPLPSRGLLAVMGWVFLAHLYAAFPDILFIAADALHVPWMDAFALHIAIHFVPLPILTTAVVFFAALGAWTAAALGRRRLAIGALIVVTAVAGAGLGLRSPIPRSLAEVCAADPALDCSEVAAAGDGPTSAAALVSVWCALPREASA